MENKRDSADDFFASKKNDGNKGSTQDSGGLLEKRRRLEDKEDEKDLTSAFAQALVGSQICVSY